MLKSDRLLAGGSNQRPPNTAMDLTPCRPLSRPARCRPSSPTFGLQEQLEAQEQTPYFDPMATTIERLAEEALKLPGESRAQLADLLVESLDSSDFGHVERQWVSEAKRRRDEIRSGKVKPIPGEEALRKARNALEE